MGNGNHVYLKEGDFSIHTMKSCADSVLSLLNGRYEGMTVYIDLQKLTDSPPCPLWNTGITGDVLYDKFCKGGQTTCLMGNSQTENIFQFFFNQPDNLKLPYQKIKVLELLLYLYKMEHISELSLTEYQSEQIEIGQTNPRTAVAESGSTLYH